MTREQVAATLNTMPDVRWDRLTVEPGLTRVYGWLERQDGRSDFVLIDFFGDLDSELEEDYEVAFVTSSAQHSERLLRQLLGGGGGLEHVDCQRVERRLPAVRCRVEL